VSDFDTQHATNDAGQIRLAVEEIGQTSSLIHGEPQGSALKTSQDHYVLWWCLPQGAIRDCQKRLTRVSWRQL